MLRLHQITINSDLEGLDRFLDIIDADFTGTNGDDVCIDGKSELQRAIESSSIYSDTAKALEHILQKCYEYSIGYYDEFKYSVEKTGDDEYLLTVATYTA